MSKSVSFHSKLLSSKHSLIILTGSRVGLLEVCLVWLASV